MAAIKSKLNEVMAYLANVGYKGKTRTVKFQPMRKGKTFINRACAKDGCGYKMGVVFRGFEDKNLFLVWCPKCNRISFPKAGDSKPAEEKVDNREGLCAGETKEGKPCTKKAGPNGYCHLHQNQAPCYEGKGLAAQKLGIADRI
jgi:hypothetical protein